MSSITASSADANMNRVLPFWITALESMKMTTNLKVSYVYSRNYLVCPFCQASTAMKIDKLQVVSTVVQQCVNTRDLSVDCGA
ncbi:G patch domain-containing protein [Trifolium repens]|nr:G patch domain-containing protein [Trifolium repens]